MPLTWGSYAITAALPYLLVQGVAVGVIASLSYAFAIARLGPDRCAGIGAVTPALTALLGALLLGEPLTPLTLGAVAAICAGVVIFNRR